MKILIDILPGKKYSLNVIFTFLCLAYFMIIVNYNILGPIRLSDIFILAGLFVTILYSGIKKNLFWVLFTIIVLLGASMVMGAVEVGFRRADRIFFLYKFIFPFIPPIMVYAIDWNARRMRQVHKIGLIVFLTLMVWVYLYMILKFFGMPGNWRPKWPFSSEVFGSDAHLYSSFLVTNLIFFTSYWRKVFRISEFWQVLVFILTIGATILTGSRTGIVMLVGFLVIDRMSRPMISMTIKRSRLMYLSAMSVPILFVIVGFGFSNIDKNEDRGLFRTTRTILRSFKFDVGDDGSSNARVRKLKMSFQESSKTHLFFGPGMVSMKGNWYDGYIAQVNALMGGLGLIFMLLLPFGIIYKHFFASKRSGTREEFRVFTLILLVYFLANFITEYFLVTRGVLSISIFLSLLSATMFNKAPSLLKEA